MKHPENFISHRFVQSSYENLQLEYLELDRLSKSSDTTDKNIESRKKITKIQSHFAKANNLYYSKKYKKALDEYKLTQGLIYQSMNPTFSGRLAINPNVVLPLDQKVFEPMLKSSLILVDAISPQSYKDSVASNPLELGTGITKETDKYNGLGMQISDGLSRPVKSAMSLGLEYANQGDWTKAGHFFTSASKAIGTGTSASTKKAKASLDMNLGAVALQLGDIQKAKSHTEKALTTFTASKDTFGQAQAKFNLATILNKEGKKDLAAKTYSEAEALLGKSHGKVDPIAIEKIKVPLANPVSPAIRISNTPIATNISVLGNRAATARFPKAFKKDYTLLSNTQGAKVIMSDPSAGEQWITQELTDKISKKDDSYTKELGLLVGNEVTAFKWKNGAEPDAAKIRKELFEKRVSANDFYRITPAYELATDFASRLPHLYFYQIPICIADCYNKLGEYNKALNTYLNAAKYQYINLNFEVPALWLKIASNYLDWGNSMYKNGEPQDALTQYSKVIKPDDTVPVSAPLYKTVLKNYGDQVATFIAAIDNPAASNLNPKVKSIILDVRAKILSIAAGLDFWGYQANFFPIFKFEYLQSVAQYFCQQASQAEKQYIGFASQGENEELTKTQLENSVDLAQAEVDLSQKQIEYSEAQLEVSKENADLSALRIANAKAAKNQFADVSYDMAALDAASVFASGPEGYSVSYSYHSQTSGEKVTVSGSDAYKVMEEAAWKKGMLSRDMELSNMQRNIDELTQSKAIADAQQDAAEKQLEINKQQKKIAEMNQQFANEMLTQFESQNFTPEVWFQLANGMLYISKSYLYRAIGIAKKMQKAYELETGEDVNIIKSNYNTNILSGLLGADYLLKDVDYFTVHHIYNSKSKDIPVVQNFSLAELNPQGFEITFKQTGKVEFETSFEEFDRNYPGSYLRKLKKVEVVVEGLVPPGGLHGTLKNSGISKARKRTGQSYYRVQPSETLFVSSHRPKQDISIFQPDSKVLGVFENCGVASGWTFELPKHSNDLSYDTITDVKLNFYYTARYYAPLEQTVKNNLSANGEQSMVIPFRVLFPDEYFTFLDTGVLSFDLRASDFPYHQDSFKIKNLSLRINTKDGVAKNGIHLQLKPSAGGAQLANKTDADGIIRTDSTDNQNPLNLLVGKKVLSAWQVTLNEANNPGFNRNDLKDMFLFVEYSFHYKGL